MCCGIWFISMNVNVIIITLIQQYIVLEFNPWFTLPDFLMFCWIDGVKMASNALTPLQENGIWNLEQDVFPNAHSWSLMSTYFIPSCKFKNGAIAPSTHEIPFEYARKHNAKLFIHCNMSLFQDVNVTHLSLNDQEYFKVEGEKLFTCIGPKSKNCWRFTFQTS